MQNYPWEMLSTHYTTPSFSRVLVSQLPQPYIKKWLTET